MSKQPSTTKRSIVPMKFFQTTSCAKSSIKLERTGLKDTNGKLVFRLIKNIVGKAIFRRDPMPGLTFMSV